MGEGLRARGKLRFVAAAVACGSFLLGAGQASAGTGELWLKSFEFDGSDTTAGKFGAEVGAIAIDQEAGIVYVVDRSKGVIDRFDLDGEAQPFASSGESSLDPYSEVSNFVTAHHDIAVDSYGIHQGRFYVSYNRESPIAPGKALPVRPFEPSGEPVDGGACELEVELEIYGLAVDVGGGLWLGNSTNDSLQGRADAYDAGVCPPEQLAKMKVGFIKELGCDAAGNLYVGTGQLKKFEGTCDLEDDLEPTTLIKDHVDFAIDQSDPEGHVFALRSGGFEDDFFSEFSAEGELLGSFAEEEFFDAQRIAHYAHPIDEAQDRVYISDNGKEFVDDSRVVVFEKFEVTTPDVTLDSVAEYGGATAKFSGTVNPLGVNSSYHFEWKRADQSWAEAKSSPSAVLPTEDKDFAVAHQATGLVPATIFNVRLVAENTDLKVKEISAERSFSNIAPGVDTVGAAPRTQTTARLNARVYPSANPTSVSFEFSKDGGESWEALGEHLIPEGATTAVAIGEELSGLPPGATYHYRVLAENELGPASPQGEVRTFTTRTQEEADEVDPVECPNAALRASQHTTYLGSCRAIELVNSPDKGNQGAGADRMRADGNRALWAVSGGSPGGNSGSGDTFLARRTPPGWNPGTDPTGWVSNTVIPPVDQQVGGGDLSYNMLLANPDLSCFLFRINRDGEGPVLARIGEGGEQDLLRSYPTPPANPNFRAAMSEDCSQVLALDREKAPEQLEEVGDGAIEIVSVMPDGTPSGCGLKTEGAAGFLGEAMISVDASMVYFRAAPNGSCGAPLGLYLRDRKAATTTLVALGAAGQSIEFIRASEDGSVAYFTTHGNCRRHNQVSGACEASEAADTKSHADVYRFEAQSGESSCLTCVVPDADVDLSSGSVLVSDDLSHVYFQSEKRLLAGKGKAGSLNLYSLSGGELRFVAELSDGGALDGTPLLSTDGNLLAFKADPNPSLSADPIAAQCPSADVGGGLGPCSQLYLYDDRDESLECVSCARDRETVHAANLESGFRVSADGSTIAFATSQGLDAGNDINNDTDLYEWRAGEQRLITDGQGSFPTKFAAPRVVAVDAGGRSIYFGVVAPGLSGFEHDGLSNLYIARIGGGFRVPSPPTPCVEDSCQGSLVPPPPADPPVSSGFQGAGNLIPPKGRRPCARKRGAAKRRCVKKQRAKHRRAQRKARDSSAEGVER